MHTISLMLSALLATAAINAVSVSKRENELENWDPLWPFKKSASCPEALVSLTTCAQFAKMDTLKYELGYSSKVSCDRWKILERCLAVGTKPCNTPNGVQKFFVNLSKLYNADIYNQCIAEKPARSDFMLRSIMKEVRQSDDEESDDHCSANGMWFMFGCVNK
ncbi:hypothetical protein TrispH2_003208 [Trichoplax sp. H2]|nr:hypothetical protein TrispH2_003208 [Trichoplax sp. H2]|eukprot:RDD45003.1 hypothetical protein TrispH2_003208 [Trichoplax sp. H2]